MKKLVIIAVMAVVDAAYRDERRSSSSVSSYDEFPPYREALQHPPFHEQHQPFREQSFKPQKYQSYRPRPYRQEMSFPAHSSFEGQPLLTDYTSLRTRPFYRDQISNFKGQSSTFLDGTSFRDQEFRDQPPLRNEQPFEGQSEFDEQYSNQQPPFHDDMRSFPDSPQSYRDGSYGKTEQHSFMRNSDYLKYGNHGMGFASVPTISPYENALPLNEETSTTMPSSTAESGTHKPMMPSTDSSTVVPAITQVHTSEASSSKMSAQKSSQATMKSTKSDRLADVSATTASTQIISTMSTAMPVTAKQSLNLGHSTTGLSSLPVTVTETPIVSFGGNSQPSMQFQTTKLTSAAPSSIYIPNDLNNNIQHSVDNYLLLEQPKSLYKNNVQNALLKYIFPQVTTENLSNKLQPPMLNFLLQEEQSKNVLKGAQRSFYDYILPQGSKQSLLLQQSSQPETLNYLPLSSLGDRQKFTLPSIPIATLSAVSRPLQTINYVPTTTLPRVSFMDSSVAPSFQIGTTLHAGMQSNMQENQPINTIFGSLPAEMTSGITAGIPSNVSPSISSRIPTFNFGQNIQHMGQTQQFEAPRNHQLFSTGGLEMQLGGTFGGMDYTSQSNNPAQRSMELGIAKVGLSLPELTRSHVPTFAKIGFGHQLW